MIMGWDGHVKLIDFDLSEKEDNDGSCIRRLKGT